MEVMTDVFNATAGSQLNYADSVIDSVTGQTAEDPIDYGMCLFHDTLGTYTDCCTDSSLKVCNYLAIMFFASFVAYGGLFIYIMNKNPWIKHHGYYIQVFTFQMLVLLSKSKHTSSNPYSARTVLCDIRADEQHEPEPVHGVPHGAAAVFDLEHDELRNPADPDEQALQR